MTNPSLHPLYVAMWYVMAALFILCGIATTLVGQDIGELAGGAAYNVALTIPRQGTGTEKLVLFTVGSAAYEIYIDPSHQTRCGGISGRTFGQVGYGCWGNPTQGVLDFANREVGYLLTEVIRRGVDRVAIFHRHK